LRGAAGHVDAGNGAFTEADGAAGGAFGDSVAVGVAVATHQFGEVLVEVGVVSDDEDAFAVAVLVEELLEGGVVSVGGEGGGDDDGEIESELGADELGGLAGAFEGAGDDDVDLDLESGEDSGHEHALLLAFFDQAAFGVKERVFTGDAGIGVTHQVEVHTVIGEEPGVARRGVQRRF